MLQSVKSSEHTHLNLVSFRWGKIFIYKFVETHLPHRLKITANRVSDRSETSFTLE